MELVINSITFAMFIRLCGLILTVAFAVPALGAGPVQPRDVIGQRYAGFRIPGTPILFRYTAGDSTAGATFSRTSTATYTDASGVIQTAASGVLRDAHYVGGVRTTLMEGSRTNLLLRSQEIGIAPWATELFSGATVTLDSTTATSPSGASNASRYTVGSTGTGYIKQEGFSTALSGDMTFSIWARRVSGSGSITLQIQKSGGDFATYGSTSITGTISSSWQRFSTSCNKPADGNAPRVGLLVAAGQTIEVWQGQFEAGAFASSPIPTTAATVTRAADSLSFPFTHPPQEMSVYVRFVDGGSGSTAATIRVVHVGGPTATTAPRISLARSANLTDGYVFVHHNAVNQTAISGVQPSVGTTVELIGQLSTAGAPTMLSSVNGGVITSVSGPATPLAPTWSQNTLNIGQYAAADSHFGAFRDIVIVKGTRDMSYMRGRVAP